VRRVAGTRARRLVLVALAVALTLGGGCRRGLVRPGRLDEAAMRARIAGNFDGLRRLEQSWRGVYEDGERRLPFRLDLDWCPDSARLALCSPFGGELAVLRCGAAKAPSARTGSSLGGWLARAAAALPDPALGSWLERGARWLEGRPDAGLDLEVRDPALVPLLALALDRLPGELREGGLCRRESLAPWLWGEWRPSAEAAWRPADLLFAVPEGRWRVHARVGLVERAERDGWVAELDDFTRAEGVWLPGRISLSQPAEGRRVVLQSRERRVVVDMGER